MVDNCLLCQGFLNIDITWAQIYLWQPLDWPVLCRTCLNQFERVRKEGLSCNGCGRKLIENGTSIFNRPIKYQNNSYCLDCRNWLEKYPLHFVNHQPLLTYNDFFKDWLFRYKYQGDVRLAKGIAHYLLEIKKKYPSHHWVPIPSSVASYSQRRFQPTSQLLIEAGIKPYELLSHIGEGPRQAQKNKKDRLALGRILEVSLTPKKRYEKLIIFDDVYTTGATMMQAKEVISEFFLQRFESSPEIKSISLARDVIKE